MTKTTMQRPRILLRTPHVLRRFRMPVRGRIMLSCASCGGALVRAIAGNGNGFCGECLSTSRHAVARNELGGEG